MKNLIMLAFLALVAVSVSAQCLQKGNLAGVHAFNLKPEPDVTIEQMKEFLFGKYLAAYEQCFTGTKVFPLKGIRGENAELIGMIVIFKDESARNEFWNDDGSFTDKGNAAVASMQSVIDEMDKLGTLTSVYTDWLIE
jgi:hypothetical protein